MPEAPHLEAVLFDLDGVITDTAHYHFIAWRELANALDIPFSESENERLKGVSRMESLDLILSLDNRHLPLEEKERLAREKNERYTALISEITSADLLPGVMELFSELKEAGVYIGLGSASKNARAILERLNITDFFDIIIDGTDITKSKPDPEVFLLGAQRLGVSAANCVGVEDASSGIEAILSAGMKAVGVGNPQSLSRAHLVVPSLSQLDLSALKKLANSTR